MKKIFETKRLYIKSVATEDAPFILELMNTPKWIEFIGDRNVTTEKDAEAYIQEKALPQFEKFGYGNNVIFLKENHKKIGTCGVYHREGKSEPDIGFAFLPNFEGKGYAFEANTELIKYMRNVHELTELSAYTLEENLRSRKLLERLGFKLIGVGTLPPTNEELLHYHRLLDV